MMNRSILIFFDFASPQSCHFLANRFIVAFVGKQASINCFKNLKNSSSSTNWFANSAWLDRVVSMIFINRIHQSRAVGSTTPFISSRGLKSRMNSVIKRKISNPFNKTDTVLYCHADLGSKPQTVKNCLIYSSEILRGRRWSRTEIGNDWNLSSFVKSKKWLHSSSSNADVSRLWSILN